MSVFNFKKFIYSYQYSVKKTNPLPKFDNPHITDLTVEISRVEP